jgi:hypothetical protein
MFLSSSVVTISPIRLPATHPLKVPQLVTLVVGVEHLLAAGQGERVGVEVGGDAVTGDLSQRGDVSLEGRAEGLL